MTTSTKTTFGTPTPTTVVVTRAFDAPRALVFAAHTDPLHVPHWMIGPDGWAMRVCEIDLRPGGAWYFVWRKDDGSEMEMTGVYLEVDPPGRLVNTENWGAEWPESVQTLELTEEGGRTTMVATLTYPSEQSRDAALATGMTSGMDISYRRLDTHLLHLSRPRSQG